MEPPGTPSHRMHATPDGPPMSTPGPHLPGEAFSFPVTPVADAPAPADTVFGAWPSFRKKKRQVCTVQRSSVPHLCFARSLLALTP